MGAQDSIWWGCGRGGDGSEEAGSQMGWLQAMCCKRGAWVRMCSGGWPQLLWQLGDALKDGMWIHVWGPYSSVWVGDKKDPELEAGAADGECERTFFPQQQDQENWLGVVRTASKMGLVLRMVTDLPAHTHWATMGVKVWKGSHEFNSSHLGLGWLKYSWRYELGDWEKMEL